MRPAFTLRPIQANGPSVLAVDSAGRCFLRDGPRGKARPVTLAESVAFVERANFAPGLDGFNVGPGARAWFRVLASAVKGA